MFNRWGYYKKSLENIINQESFLVIEMRIQDFVFIHSYRQVESRSWLYETHHIFVTTQKTEYRTFLGKGEGRRQCNVGTAECSASGSIDSPFPSPFIPFRSLSETTDKLPPTPHPSVRSNVRTLYRTQATKRNINFLQSWKLFHFRLISN